MRHGWRVLFALAAASLSTACTTGAAARSQYRTPAATRSQYNVLTGDEMRRLEPNEMLLSALQHLRPLFLGSPRSAPTIFIDGVKVAFLSDLATVFASSVLDVTLVRGPLSYSAITPTGAVVVGDALLIRTRRSFR